MSIRRLLFAAVGLVAVPLLSGSAGANAPLLVDVDGDANGIDTYLVPFTFIDDHTFEPTGIGNDPAADIVAGDVRIDGTDLVFVTQVTDVDAPLTDGAVGRRYYFDVVLDGVVNLTADVWTRGEELRASATYVSRDRGVTVPIDAIGVIDSASDVVEARVALSDLNAIAGVVDDAQVGVGTAVSEPHVQTYDTHPFDVEAFDHRGDLALRFRDSAGFAETKAL